MPVLAIWSPCDVVLGAVAPLGLAAAAGTALVVDLDRDGPRYPGSGSLARLVEEGPRRVDLEPKRTGVAVLSNGGIGEDEAEEVLRALVEGWPAVVLRLPQDHPAGSRAVPVYPLLTGALLKTPGPRAVYQRSGWRVEAPRGSVVLPRPSRRTLTTFLSGRMPPRRDRWVASWNQVWERRWE